MALAPGTRVGANEIVSAIGAGGMGEVYRARDTRLKRDVALKILPASVAQDRDRVARFEREAELLAALNHPNIAAIYGIEEFDGNVALVMELIDGEDLAARIHRGPLPVEEVLPIARQLAEALEAAHERGIIHRDLKPANVKVRADGSVKVLDFGLAKALEPAQGASAGQVLSQSATITSAAMTQAGMILGTAAYMSPEQARGRPVDRRADIWAFGVLLFEMLTGRRAFGGEDMADTIASVVRAEPEWQWLTPDVPPAVRTLIRRCLEKDPNRRPSHFSAATFALSSVGESPSSASSAAASPAIRRPALASRLAALAAVASVASTITWWVVGRDRVPPSATPIRFTVAAETGEETWRITTDRPFAISPDGRAVVYRTQVGDQQRLLIRTFDALESRVLVDSTGPLRSPFFSADSQWVGFFSVGELKKVRVSGGPVAAIAKIPSVIILGASWGDDDAIVYATRQPAATGTFPGLMIVPASGGEPRALTMVESDRGEIAHFFPTVLPQSRGVVFKVGRTGGAQNEGPLVVLDRVSGERRELPVSGVAPEYVHGRLVYNDLEGNLHAVAFDLSKLAPSGEPEVLDGRVHAPAVGQPQFSVATSGALAFVPALGNPAAESARTLVWVDRDGKETPIAAPPRTYAVARLSPDGTEIALDSRDEGNDIWTWSVTRGVLTKLTSGPTLDFAPIWSFDGRRIIWSSSRATPNPVLYWQAADGTGAPERIGKVGGAAFPGSVTPDGALLYVSSTQILRLPLDASRAEETVLEATSLILTPEVSRDGRWIAYQSNEDGRPQIYVRPYPNIDAGKWQLSTGGSRPAWSRDGRELFFLDAEGRLSVVPITVSGDKLVPGPARRILETAYYPGFTTRGLALRGYDVSSDGKRFLMIKAARSESSWHSLMTVVLNWP